MDYGIVGVSHHTANIEIRERLNFTPEQRQKAYALARAGHVGEIMLLSTCNRVEVLTHGLGEGLDEFAESLLSEVTEVPAAMFRANLRRYRGRDAVRHAMRVAGGLDSMVLGEPQILGQWKDAFQAATESGAAGLYLQRLGQRTLQVAKRIRTETDIGRHAVNLSTVAVQLAEEIFEPLADKSVLVLGAGEMAELAVAHFKSRGIRKLTICNRTESRAAELAHLYNAEARPWAAWPEEIAAADVVLVSAGGQTRLLDSGDVRAALKHATPKPRLIVDLAVPRAVDPKVGKIRDTFLYSIDDLQRLAHENLDRRASGAQAAESIVDGAVENFQAWYERQKLAPALGDLTSWLERLRASEAARSLKSAGDLPAAELVEHATSALARRLAKQIAKNANASADQRVWVDVISALIEDSNEEMETREVESRIS